MMKFDNLALELGWEKPFQEIPLYTTVNKKGKNECVFDIGHHYDTAKDDERLTLEHIKSLFRFYPKTVFEDKDRDWVLPMLASDYYAHRFDWDNELVWAKISMDNNKELKPTCFSSKIRDKLC
jgi:hypothetical protein